MGNRRKRLFDEGLYSGNQKIKRITNTHVPTIHLKREGIFSQLHPWYVSLVETSSLPFSVWISYFPVHIFLCAFMIQSFDWRPFLRWKQSLSMSGCEFLSCKVRCHPCFLHWGWSIECKVLALKSCMTHIR